MRCMNRKQQWLGGTVLSLVCQGCCTIYNLFVSSKVASGLWRVSRRMGRKMILSPDNFMHHISSYGMTFFPEAGLHFVQILRFMCLDRNQGYELCSSWVTPGNSLCVYESIVLFLRSRSRAVCLHSISVLHRRVPVSVLRYGSNDLGLLQYRISVFICPLCYAVYLCALLRLSPASPRKSDGCA